jgi:membrane protease YdiL (CAAX protease family)
MAILTIFVAAVVVAPLVEEFLFRGYFYGVLKRYVGGLPSGLFTAALFAAGAYETSRRSPASSFWRSASPSPTNHPALCSCQ